MSLAGEERTNGPETMVGMYLRRPMRPGSAIGQSQIVKPGRATRTRLLPTWRSLCETDNLRPLGTSLPSLMR
jgi:hypothetical protein